MPAADFGYNIVIEQDHSPNNVRVHDFLAARVKAPYLDVGCNTGWLLEMVDGGIGIDPTFALVQRARMKGLNVVFGWGEYLPFCDNVFAYVVLSCVLEQCEEPGLVLRESLRVGRLVLGVTPYPDSPWGKGSSSPWVRSVLEPERFAANWDAQIGQCTDTHWWFEIKGGNACFAS